LGVLGVANAAHALPQDCDPNSIINCGMQSREEFRTKYNDSDELKKLYAHPMFNQAKGAGLQGNDIDRFVAESQQGKLCKNGELILDNGQKVMTDGWSMGRLKHGNPYRYPITIDTGANDNTYYYGTTQNSFGKNTTCLPVWVLFNDEGEVEFSVITACGNINWGDSVKSKYSCDKLNKTEVSGKKNTYKFTTNATAENNAQIVKVIYDFGDGSPKVEKTNPAEAVEHTYTKTGNFTARVTVVVSLPGNQTKEVTADECAKPIEVKEEPKPEYSCKSLNAYLIGGNRKYKFVATGTYKNAELVSASFDFGDGQKAENITNKVIVSPTEATITVEHQYAKEKTGKLTATADLKFKIGNDFQNKKCTVPVELSELTCKDTPEKPECKPPKECKPGIPEGDARCKEVLPAEIVKTGPAEIAAGAIGLSSLAGAGMYYRASRRQLLDKIFKR
ncbi:MAG TPA: PKD domain-containing protein, partial [Candidatus Saccharimonadales bacterium]|nr:PKD domain-containing protein [Candidatus Saccharimonadales bacterium]